MPLDLARYIWIQEAVRVYTRSREWLDEQIRAGRLSTVTSPGDRRLYLVRAELDALTRPQVRRVEERAG